MGNGGEKNNEYNHLEEEKGAEYARTKEIQTSLNAIRNALGTRA